MRIYITRYKYQYHPVITLNTSIAFFYHALWVLRIAELQRSYIIANTIIMMIPANSNHNSLQ